MAMKRMVLGIGMGTDIRGTDPTKAAVRALRDALWHNSLTVAKALDLDVDSMQVAVTVGVPNPDQVEGGLKIPNMDGTDATLLAHAAAVVYLDVA